MEKYLLLRYSDFNGVNTIREHQSVIQKTGKCWWAKLGKQPTDKYLSNYIEQPTRFVYLYTSKKLYKCEMGSISRKRPSLNYPKYYERDIFDKENEPNTFFELLSIEICDLDELNRYVVCGSGKEVMHDLKNSISSYMFIQDKSIPLVKKEKKKKAKTIVDVYSCKYNKDGFCSKKNFVKYLDPCINPRWCAGQSPYKKIVEE